MSTQRILFLTNHSFLRGFRLGMHQFALGLAAKGYDVHWLPCPATPFDIFGSLRRERLGRLLRGHWRGVPVAENLTEHTIPALFNPTPRLLRFTWQTGAYAWLMPGWLRETVFDFCVFDVSPTGIYLPHVKANRFIFRINDPLSRQAEFVQKIMLSCIYGEREATLCAVSGRFAAWVESLAPGRGVVVVPNGIDLDNYPPLESRVPAVRKAVFMGWHADWVDFGLVDAAARLLPDWEVDIYGTGPEAPQCSAPNVTVRGLVPHDQVPKVLSGYSVGLIPNKEYGDNLTFIERPLKFYAYLAAGLGIAATSAGGMRHGMENWASFGDTPEEYAAAIVRAADGPQVERAARDAFLKRHSWSAIIDEFERLCLLPGNLTK